MNARPVVELTHGSGVATLAVGTDEGGWACSFGAGHVHAAGSGPVRPLIVFDPDELDDIPANLIGDLLVASAEIVQEITGRATKEVQLLKHLAEVFDRALLKPAEPMDYLAVALTRDGKRYWRWSAGVAHTSVPWRLLGAVHADTQDEDGNFRWADLDVVEIVSEGVGL